MSQVRCEPAFGNIVLLEAEQDTEVLMTGLTLALRMNPLER